MDITAKPSLLTVLDIRLGKCCYFIRPAYDRNGEIKYKLHNKTKELSLKNWIPFSAINVNLALDIRIVM